MPVTRFCKVCLDEKSFEDLDEMLCPVCGNPVFNEDSLSQGVMERESNGNS